ncbi:heterokaryon incompatibility protein-domain-containing protein [Xylariaceae sp. FL0804]|nr:heterokaryon incompatibility protein-domain-containing protein [Xylariaceae sp. FL0804]
MEANESRRRARVLPVEDNDKGEGDASVTVPVPVTPYRPLAQDVDCTRLVKIKHATHHDDPVVCSLIHVTFGETPQYKALSYMWGDGGRRKAINLDGIELQVTDNLHDALLYLRTNYNHHSLFWIDAICINQGDVPERNRQLRFMRHIYFRAQRVLIWLGSKYNEFNPNIANYPCDGDGTLIRYKEVREDHVPMWVEEICQDGYWDRLWIIQEITQGYEPPGGNLIVCMGRAKMTWGALIKEARQLSDQDSGPLRLDRRIQARYTSGVSLAGLLREHRRAQCAEPRDKVYGLIGLAADARDFPIDYNKSLVEVWADTMGFMVDHNMLAPADIMPYARLVRRLLWSDSTLLPDDYDRARSLLRDRPTALPVPGYLLGRVARVGPTITEAASSLTAWDDWEVSTQAIFGGQRGFALRESDRLLRAILGSTHDFFYTSKDVSNFSPTTSPTTDITDPHEVDSLWPWRAMSTEETDGLECTGSLASDTGNASRIASNSITRIPVHSSKSDLRLYQLSSLKDRRRLWLPNGFNMGVAGGVAEGNYIWYIDGARRAITYCKSAGNRRPNWHQIVGLALPTAKIMYPGRDPGQSSVVAGMLRKMGAREEKAARGKESSAEELGVRGEKGSNDSTVWEDNFSTTFSIDLATLFSVLPYRSGKPPWPTLKV